MFKEEFPPEKLKKMNPFELFKVLVDLGYIGIVKDYENLIKEIEIPHKKPRKSKKNPDPKLTKEQKEENKKISSIRIKVENAIGGSKRMGAVSQIFRNKAPEFNDLVMEIACSLWNYHLSF